MAHDYHTKLPHINGYPGNGYYYILCDVCGWKVRAKDAVLIKDKYNLLNNCLVCLKCDEKANPQTYIRPFYDRQIDNPEFIRGEAADEYQTDPTSTDVPGQAQQLRILTPDVSLEWLGPLNGSEGGNIIGYIIQRKTDAGSFATIVANTDGPATYWVDDTVVTGHTYTYKVAALNTNGAGDYSNTAAITI